MDGSNFTGELEEFLVIQIRANVENSNHLEEKDCRKSNQSIYRSFIISEIHREEVPRNIVFAYMKI